MGNNFLCKRDKCTLCMACANVCTREAITVELDEYGYEYVDINSNLCIECGLCGKVCEKRKKVGRNQPIKTFAAQMKQKKDLRKSASGGAFQAIANWILEMGGCCYGCLGRFENSQFITKHIRIDKKEDLYKILNSKYTLSKIGDTYKSVATDLRNDKWVLFCGTPCQVLGLKAYLNAEHQKLITVDIICHGVTSLKIFNDYIKAIEAIDDIHITDYLFRDKSVAWGTNYQYSYIDKKGRKKEKHCPREESSYMAHYLSGMLFRENCYTCTLSNIERVSDLTLGDFWGIEHTHPELATLGKDRMSIKGGVSCILANTSKGMKVLKMLAPELLTKEVDLESVVSNNGNLQNCSPRNIQRDSFMNYYKENGYKAIELSYRRRIKKRKSLYRLKNTIKSYMPDWMRIRLYQIFIK